MLKSCFDLNMNHILNIIDEGLLVINSNRDLLYINQPALNTLCIADGSIFHEILTIILNLKWFDTDNIILSQKDNPIFKLLENKKHNPITAGFENPLTGSVIWVKSAIKAYDNDKQIIITRDVTDSIEQTSLIKSIHVEHQNINDKASSCELVHEHEIKQRHFIREILDTLEVPIAVISHPDQKYEIVNRNKCLSLSKIVGYPLKEEDIIGRFIKDVAPIFHEKGVRDTALLAGYTKETIVLDNVEYINSSGESVIQKVFLCPVFDEQGEVTHVASVGIDLTEEILIQNKIQELSRAKEEFFSVISHELRTPINVILSAEKVITTMINTPIDSDIIKIQRWLRMIRQNSLRLLKLVNNILDLSKIDAGFLVASKKNIDFIALIRKIYSSIAPFVEQKGLKISFVTKIKKLTIAVDEEKIERVIFNLISNAVKYNKEHGEIKLSILRDEKSVYINVRDTGIGIPEDKLEIIFERFLQVNSSLSRHREGAGIGLSLCKAIASLHEGEVYAKSKINKGSVFTLKLPIALVEDSSEIESEKVSNYSEISAIELSDIYEI